MGQAVIHTKQLAIFYLGFIHHGAIQYHFDHSIYIPLQKKANEHMVTWIIAGPWARVYHELRDRRYGRVPALLGGQACRGGHVWCRRRALCGVPVLVSDLAPAHPWAQPQVHPHAHHGRVVQLETCLKGVAFRIFNRIWVLTTLHF